MKPPADSSSWPSYTLYNRNKLINIQKWNKEPNFRFLDSVFFLDGDYIVEVAIVEA